MRYSFGFALASIAMMTFSSIAQAVTINTYLSAPKVQGTIFSGTTVETFETLVTGNRISNFASVIGTHQLSPGNPFNIQADNQYGSGTGNYVALGAQSGTSAPFALVFKAPVAYFGFSWNAGDNNNGISFFSGNVLVGKFASSSVQTKLSGSTVTALDGATYASSQYKGKPPAGTLNSGENYSFINFIATGGTFDKIVFDNSGQTGSGFESDNHTILTTSPTPDHTFVFVSNITIVPEPSGSATALGALGALCAFSLFCASRKRREIPA